MIQELQTALNKIRRSIADTRKELQNLERDYYLFLDDLIYEKGRIRLDRQDYIRLAVIGLCRYDYRLQQTFYYSTDGDTIRHKTVAERVGRLYANRTAGRKELVELLKQWERERITDRDLLIELNRRFPSKRKKRK